MRKSVRIETNSPLNDFIEPKPQLKDCYDIDIIDEELSSLSEGKEVENLKQAPLSGMMTEKEDSLVVVDIGPQPQSKS